MTVAEFWSEQYRVVVEEKKTLGERLRETLKENKDLQQKINGLKTYKEALRSINSGLNRKLSSSIHQAQELEMQLKQKEDENSALHSLVDSFVDKCTGLENKVERYESALKDEHERLDKSIADRAELQADRDIWFRKNGEKQAEIQSLKAELNSIERSRDTWRTEAERLRKEITESYSDGYSDGNEEGQNELWEMLQLINDVKPFEAPYFEDVTSINDIISWDLEDFKEAYGKWEEEQRKVAEEAKKQHVEYMRDYLKRYCIGRLCTNCPLHDASRLVTSCVFSKLSDEEVEKRYNKVIKSERELKKIPTPVSARLPQPWECTFEAKVEINEDILKVVCGIKDDEEDHELVYGDAVRIPWCDYDYMYIGPEPEATETQARLFDPKNHTVVVTFATNVTYNGGKVILTREGEDDLRKIWKDKK